MKSVSRFSVPTSHCPFFRIEALRHLYDLDAMRASDAYDDAFYRFFLGYQRALEGIITLAHVTDGYSSLGRALVFLGTVADDHGFKRTNLTGDTDLACSIYRDLLSAYSLRTARQAVSMTQKSMASVLSVSVSTLQRYESLRLRVPFNILFNCSNALTFRRMTSEKPAISRCSGQATIRRARTSVI